MKQPRGDRLAATLPEVRVDMSWVTLDRICQQKADAEEDFRDIAVAPGFGAS
jgi:hypothetical protein